MEAFLNAFAIVVGVEGGYGTDPHDDGNWTGGAVGEGELRGTKYGISAAAYPTLDIASLTLADAQHIYGEDYWAPIGGNGHVDALPLPTYCALLTFDAAVNQGVAHAIAWLQTALGVNVDGDVGPLTLEAAQRADPLELVSALVWQRDQGYRAARNWPRYGHGWINRLSRVTFLSAIYTDRAELAQYLPHIGDVLT